MNQKHGVSRSMPMAASVTEEETTQNNNQNQTVEEERESFTCATLLVNASVLALALKTVVDLGVLDVLSMADPDVGLTAAEISERIPTRNPEAPGMLERILRLMMNEGVVYCSSDLFDEAPMKYRLGRVGKYFVRDENGVSLAPLMTLAHDKVYLETWCKACGGRYVQKCSKGDAIILKWILRDWDYEHCLKLLKNCYMSVPVDGKIIVVEQILPTFAEISAVSKDKCQLDKVSLTQTPGGKERMQGHLRNLAISAGFKDIIHVSYVYHYSVMEFLKWMISLPF